MSGEDGVIYSERNGHTLKFHEKSHRYFLKKSGEAKFRPLVSTTTYSKFFPESERLTKWKIQQGLDEYITGKKLDKAGETGSWAHRIILEIEQGKTPEIPEVPELQNCIRLFMGWREKVGKHDKIIKQEAIMCDPDRMVAGTLDRLSERRGKVVLTDFKTSKGIYGSYLFQLGSYDHLLQAWFGIVPDIWEIVRFGKQDDTDEVESWQRGRDSDLMEAYKAQSLLNLESYRFNAKYQP